MIKVSVVIPTFRRRPLLKQCLLRLCLQTIDPSEFEVLVCDDENSLKTCDVITNLNAEYPRHQIRWTGVYPHHGPAAARNRGWQKARGEIIAFTNDDCLPEQDWLETALADFNGHDALWGKVVGISRTGFVTANCFCRRPMLEKIHGFDERFLDGWREGSDLYFSLLEQRASVAYLPQAVVVHPARQTSLARSLYLQRNNLYEPLLYKKHPALYQQYTALPTIKTFYAMVLLMIISMAAFIGHLALLGWAAMSAWAFLSLSFMVSRLRNSSRRFKDVLEMVLASLCIPPLVVYWRLLGNLKFRNI